MKLSILWEAKPKLVPLSAQNPFGLTLGQPKPAPPPKPPKKKPVIQATKNHIRSLVRDFGVLGARTARSRSVCLQIRSEALCVELVKSQEERSAE